MRLRRDSLLIKIIFYNDIAIILTSLMIAGILTFITFKDMDSATKRVTQEKVKTLDKYFEFYVDGISDDVFQISNNYINSDTEKNYTLLATTLKSELDNKNFKAYKNAVISIRGYDGNQLGVSGQEEDVKRLDATNSETYLNFLAGNKHRVKNVYQEAIDGETIIRISVPIFTDKKIKEIILSLNIEKEFLDRAKEILGLNEKHKLFYFQGSNINTEIKAPGIVYSDFDKMETYVYDEILPKRNRVFEDLKLDYTKFIKIDEHYYKDINFGKESYYIGISPLVGNSGNVLGSFGVALSKSDVIHMKVLVLLLITSITIVLILFNSVIFGKIFYKMLNPLVEVAEASNKIARGESDITLKLQGSGEIRSMVKSFKKMIKTIEMKENALKKKNNKLQENITRIDVIEKLLLGIHGEEDIFDVIKTILRAMTSEVGLGYSRGVFLRYSREIESLVGEYSMVNNLLKYEKRNENFTGSFKFDKKSIDEMISYIKINIREKSLLSKALLEKKIIYYNDKSYKYNIGNELLQSMGFHNFIIIPIYSEDRDYGCIILDNYLKDRKINPEEVELLNLLLLNLGIHFKNRSLEEEKLENERSLTIGKLSEKFLIERESLLNKIYGLIEEAKSGQDQIPQKLMALEKELINIKREDSILTEYSDRKEYYLERVSVNDILNELYLENKEIISEKGISISLFVKYDGKVLGDRKELKKAFTEILDNAIDAVIVNGKPNKKINVILSKGKNTEKLRVQVIDNGIGMSETEMQTIGEPFVSYKKEAAGLGLSIAFRIIKHHKGIMKFVSHPDEGTEVKITLNDYKEEHK